jgi:toxin ParE1/3/4
VGTYSFTKAAIQDLE